MTNANTPTDTGDAGESKLSCSIESPRAEVCRLVSHLDGVVFWSRWLLFPIEVALIAALLVYEGKFLFSLYDQVLHLGEVNIESLLVTLLGMVDSFMVASLVVMIIQGGHQIFIRRLRVEDESARPQWLDHIDSGILKVKMSMSIAGITMVRILKDFVDLENMDWNIVVHRMMVHAMCLGSVLVMAVVWRFMHPLPSQHQVAPKRT